MWEFGVQAFRRRGRAGRGFIRRRDHAPVPNIYIFFTFFVVLCTFVVLWPVKVLVSRFVTGYVGLVRTQQRFDSREMFIMRVVATRGSGAVAPLVLYGGLARSVWYLLLERVGWRTSACRERRTWCRGRLLVVTLLCGLRFFLRGTDSCHVSTGDVRCLCLILSASRVDLVFASATLSLSSCCWVWKSKIATNNFAQCSSFNRVIDVTAGPLRVFGLGQWANLRAIYYT